MKLKTRDVLHGALLALALFAVGCADEEPTVQEEEVAAPAISAARPEAARPKPTAAAPAQAPMPDIDPCALIPQDDVARILGGPGQAREVPVRRTRGHTGTFASCEYGVGRAGGPRKALRLDLIIERSWGRKDVTLDGHWQSLTLGNSEARRVDALDGKAYWLPESPPVRNMLLVRGSRGVYELRSAWFGKSRLSSDEVEALAEALLAAE